MSSGSFFSDISDSCAGRTWVWAQLRLLTVITPAPFMGLAFLKAAGGVLRGNIPRGRSEDSKRLRQELQDFLWPSLRKHAAYCVLSSTDVVEIRPYQLQGKGDWVYHLTCASTLSRVRLFVTPWAVACQAPLSVGFSRQEYWSELPFHSAGDPPNPKIEPMSLASPVLAGRFFTSGATKEALPCDGGGKVTQQETLWLLITGKLSLDKQILPQGSCGI